MSSGITLIRTTSALLGRASRNSERVISPINDSALALDAQGPAFYCVHSASGVAGTDFLALASRFEPSIRFYGIQAPPKHMRDAQFGRSVESIAEHYVEALVKFQPQGPIVLGGYCVGAIIALEMAKNWLVHGDLMRNRTLRSLVWSLSNNAYAIAKRAIGLKRGEKLGGGYSIEGIMDLSPYQPAHRLFINRLFNALFAYVPSEYPGRVVVYEAKITPLLYLPQIGRTWRKFAPQSEVVDIVATHISMMREPYVDTLAKDMRARIAEFFSNGSR
jgi:hypothetical protein